MGSFAPSRENTGLVKSRQVQASGMDGGTELGRDDDPLIAGNSDNVSRVIDALTDRLYAAIRTGAVRDRSEMTGDSERDLLRTRPCPQRRSEIDDLADVGFTEENVSAVASRGPYHVSGTMPS